VLKLLGRIYCLCKFHKTWWITFLNYACGGYQI